MHSRHLLFSLSLLLAGLRTYAAAPVDFKREVQPILAGRCYECHGEKKQKGGIRFDRKATVFSGGDAGQPVVISGKSADSLLLQKVISTDPDQVMPPKGDRLSEVEVKLLRDWIDQGADWPEEKTAEKKHWAYQKPVRPAMPRVADPSWLRNGIDYFVLERLEQEKLQPAKEADRATLLRRASLDLTGLPPTVQEVDAFLADASTNAFDQVVRRLLASTHYGERWARPWLDVARYADTAGYESDRQRTMWPWRDWVVTALNRNMPFDQFTIDQIAGDLLPGATQEQRVATGFHRNTMTNNEGGTDDEEFRHEAVVDRVNTTFSAWMATTIQCAQCHNHKYDPFTMKEYYQLYAFLNNTADSDKMDERPILKVPTSEQAAELARRTEVLKRAEAAFTSATIRPQMAEAQTVWEEDTLRALSSWQIPTPLTFTSAAGAAISLQASRALLVSGANASNDSYRVTAVPGPGRLTGFRLEVLETGDLKELGRGANGLFVLRRFEASLIAGGQTNELKFSNASADYSEKRFDVDNLLSGKGEGWTVATSDPRTRVRRSAYFTLERPVTVASNALLTFSLQHNEKFAGANLMRFRLYTTGVEPVGPPVTLSNDVRAILLTASEKRDVKQRAKLKEHFQSVAPELKAVRDALAAARKAEKEWNDAIPIVAVMEELEKPRETHMMIRGSFLNKGERVSTGVPAVLNPLPPEDEPTRLAFARWLVDTNNPLTARVTMNRFWEQLFGIGLVETSEDFGTQGEAPTHPALLDWLALEFMESGWDMKEMLHRIVTSATYRQASAIPAELAQRDPYNRLLARGPRRRLEAETIRDQALAVSGLLSRKIGGRPVMPPQPEGVWQVVYSGDTWEASKGEDKYRRGLYTFWRRTSPYPSMVSFDAPSREFCVVRRARSNTPLQALTLLNDPVYVEAAQSLAARMLAEAGLSPEERAGLGWRLCLSRPPREKELAKLVALAGKEKARYTSRPADAAQLLKFAGAQGQVFDPADLAAWTVVANVLLNLDEFVMVQ